MTDNLFAETRSTGLQSQATGLHVTPPAPLPFLKGVVVRSFVLERRSGPTVVYNAPGIDLAADAIRALGSPDRLILNHQHEAMFGAPKEIEIPAYVHEADRSATRVPLAGTFAGRERIDDDLELIPTPGHTPGTAAILWNNGEHRFLFPGDSIWVQNGRWRAVVLGDSDRASYLASLRTVMDLDYDYLVPWGAEENAPYAYAVTGNEAREKVGRIVERLEAGENS